MKRTSSERIHRSLAIAVVLATCSVGWSQGRSSLLLDAKASRIAPGNPSADFVRSFDADGDGQIDKTEFLKAYETMFEIMDVSGDGKIDGREFMRDPARTYYESARRAESTVRRYDADEDGRLSPYEAPFWSSVFNRADTDKDGFVVPDELTRLQFDTALLSEGLRVENPTKLTNTFLGKYDKDGDRKVAREEFEWDDRTFERYDLNKNGSLDEVEILRIPPLPPSPKSRAKETLEKLDRDRDGSLSAVEYAQPPEVFHENDTDGDGRISLDELTTAISKPASIRKADKSSRTLVAPRGNRPTLKPLKKGVRIQQPDGAGGAPKKNPAVVIPER